MLDVGSSCSLSLSLFLSLLVSAQGLHPSASGWLGGEKDLSSFGKGKIESAPEIKISRVLLSPSFSLTRSMKTFHYSNHLTFFGPGDPIPSRPIPLSVGPGHH